MKPKTSRLFNWRPAFPLRFKSTVRLKVGGAIKAIAPYLFVESLNAQFQKLKKAAPVLIITRICFTGKFPSKRKGQITTKLI